MTSGEHELTTSPKNCSHECPKCFPYLEEARKPELVEKRCIERCKQQVFRICLALREPFRNVLLQSLGDIGGKSSIVIMPEIFLLQRPPISFLPPESIGRAEEAGGINYQHQRAEPRERQLREPICRDFGNQPSIRIRHGRRILDIKWIHPLAPPNKPLAPSLTKSHFLHIRQIVALLFINFVTAPSISLLPHL